MEKSVFYIWILKENNRKVQIENDSIHKISDYGRHELYMTNQEHCSDRNWSCTLLLMLLRSMNTNSLMSFLKEPKRFKRTGHDDNKMATDPNPKTRLLKTFHREVELIALRSNLFQKKGVLRNFQMRNIVSCFLFLKFLEKNPSMKLCKHFRWQMLIWCHEAATPQTLTSIKMAPKREKRTYALFDSDTALIRE